MNTDPDRWLNTLPKMSTTLQTEKCNADANRFVNTLPKVSSNNSVKKYSLPAILFVTGLTGLIFVSAIKNETRNLQKEVSGLQLSINNIKFELHQATLDHEVITSPENISRLAKEYLESNLISYKQSQIKQLNKETKNKQVLGKKSQNKTDKAKTHIAKKIEIKKNELKKLYSNPYSLLGSKKMQKWAGLQVVKVFLGIPIVPGK